MFINYRCEALQGKESFFLSVDKLLEVCVFLQKLFDFIEIGLITHREKNRKRSI